jgi:NAD-dependent SIR2 family protein deacetylase
MAKPPTPVQPQLPPMVQGPIDRVPCPHCGKPNNFRRVDEMLENGNIFSCDYCKKQMQICGVKDVRFVAVRKPGAGGAVQRRR